MKSSRLRSQSAKAAKVARQLAKHNTGICVAQRAYGTSCGGPTVVHHVIQRSVRPDLILEPSNLLTVCVRHHNDIHGAPEVAYELGFLKHSWEHPA